MRTVSILCWLSAIACALPGQTASDPNGKRQAEANLAVAAVTDRFTANPVARVPGTKKPLPSKGSWAVKSLGANDEVPDACQGDAKTCLKVVYQVPELSVECSWVVTFSGDSRTADNAEGIGIADGIKAAVVEEDDNAASYTMEKAWFQGEDAPKPSSQPLPAYPPIANVALVQGDVVIQVVVDSQGKVADASVISGPAMLLQASIDAARQWVFHPQLVGNKPTSFRTSLGFHFQSSSLGGVVTSRTF